MNNKLTLNETIKESIAIALLQLMKQKPFPQITITELVKAAGVSRNSFYRNFESKEQILCFYLNHLYSRLHISGGIPQRIACREHLDKFYLPRFRFIKQHQNLFVALYQNNLLDHAFQQLDTELVLCLSGLEPSVNKYALAMFCGASAGIIRLWISTGFKESPEEMVSIFSSATYGHAFLL